LAKSSFGIRTVNFFGYVCSGNSYHLSGERAASVDSIPFPTDQKAVQRFLGAAMYFKPFVYDYSEKTRLLTDMVHRDFDWAGDLQEYREAFQKFKGDILNSFTLYHPDYKLDWYLYVDASDLAFGGVLIQREYNGVQQVITFISHKFSKTAKAWSTYEKEAFAMYYSVHQLRQYLLGKFFVLLTDHRNLVWIETSEVPKIIRIRLYLQTYDFKILHIAGKENVFADWLSRKDAGDTQASCSAIGVARDKVTEALQAVHNARMGHNGVRRTWLLLNEHFPGNSVRMEDIADFIALCPVCQKYRIGMADSLHPPTRVLPSEHRFTCGYDLLYISPEDSDGYKYIHVLKLMPSRLVGLYPSRDLTAESLALALFQFFLTYGVVDVLITDPGSNIDSAVTKLLLTWFGVRLRMSLVNRHQSNGVERTHREILKFLSMLVADERVANIWSKAHVLGVIQFILNSQISAETGKSPFEFIFGSLDAKWFRLPDTNASPGAANSFLRALDDNLKTIREAAWGVIEKLRANRVKEAKNTYKIGDMVLLNAKTMGLKAAKLFPNFLGPYLVKGVNKADVELQHIVTHDMKTVHMEHLKPFFSDSFEDAYNAALVDSQQYVIDRILAWRGDPERRSGMSFLVKFLDGDEVWLPYRKDLWEASQFVAFCEKHAPLMPLLRTEGEWKKLCAQENRKMIETVAVGKVCYVDIRAWGHGWYASIGLPESDFVSYVVKCVYEGWGERSAVSGIGLMSSLQATVCLEEQ
jgi:hypothetical protein